MTNHGLYSQRAPKRVVDVYLRTLGRWTLNRADIVFCYTDTDKDRVRKFGVASEIKVVPNGIETKRYSPIGKKSDLIDTTGPNILFVGRLVRGKGPQHLIRALPAVRKTNPDATLYLCGEGPIRDELTQEAAELGVRDAVHFLGQVPPEEMPSVYRAGDILVLPSRAEGVPRTILEALASGVQIICTDLPQLREVVPADACFVPFGDTTAIANAIRESLGGPRRTETSAPEADWGQTVEITTRHLSELAECREA